MLMNAIAVVIVGAARTNIIRVAASGRRQSRYYTYYIYNICIRALSYKYTRIIIIRVLRAIYRAVHGRTCTRTERYWMTCANPPPI